MKIFNTNFSFAKIFFVLTILVVAGVFYTCSVSVRETKSLYKEAKTKAPYDVVIVPGYPFKNGAWDDLLKARIYWSWLLFNRGMTKNVMYSGSAVYSPYIESRIMRLYAIALGIPGNHIFTEMRAEHSTENVYYGYQLARKLGFSRIALATDPFQSKMLQQFVRKKIGAGMDFIPIIYDSLDHMDTVRVEIDPETAFVENFVPITERESLWERLRGTRGDNIDYRSKD